MYHDLTGAYKDGKVDLTMGGASCPPATCPNS